MVAQLQNTLQEKRNNIVSFLANGFKKKESLDLSDTVSLMFEKMIVNVNPKKNGLIDYYELNTNLYPYLTNKSDIDVLTFILKRTVLSRRPFEYIKIDEIANGVREGNEIYTVGTQLSKNTIMSSIKILIDRKVIFKYEFSKTRDHLYILNTPVGKLLNEKLISKELSKSDIDQMSIDLRKRKINYISLVQSLHQVSSTIALTYINHCTNLYQPLHQVSATIAPMTIVETPVITEIQRFKNPSPSVILSVLPSVLPKQKHENLEVDLLINKTEKNIKSQLLEKYISLRKNDEEYKTQLEQVFLNTNVEFLNDWYEARPYVQTEKNMAYYVLNALQNSKSLPQDYVFKKSESIKNELFNKHSVTYELITGNKAVPSLIDKNLSDLIGKIATSIKNFKSYFTEKSDKRFDETIIKTTNLHRNYLISILEKVSLNDLQTIVADVLNNSKIRKSEKKLSILSDSEIHSIISTIPTLHHHFNKEIGMV